MVYQENYWDMTNSVEVNINIGEKRRKEDMTDKEVLEEVMKEHNINEKEMRIMFTDGSKRKDKVADGCRDSRNRKR